MRAGAPSAGLCSASQDVRNVVGLRLRVAIAPALHLALDIADGFAEVAESRRGVVDRVEIDERVHEQVAQAASGGGVDACRQLLAQDDAAPAFHQIERRTEDVGLVAVGDHARRAIEHRRELREDRDLATHVVRGFHLAAERRPPQHVLAIAVMDEVRQVRVTARELLDADGAVGTELGIEVCAERGEVELFALPHGLRLVFGNTHDVNFPRMRFATTIL
jgi:hypothetical protein